jgi:hypothetical protein
MSAGGGDVVHRAGFRLRDPQREPVRGEHRLDVAAVSMRLARVPQVDDLAANADDWFLAPVAWDDLPVQDQVREALVLGALQRLAQIRGLLCQDDDDFIEVAVGGGPRDAVVTGQRVGGVRSRNQRSPSTACQKQVSARLPRGVPRRWRSAASSFATNCTVSLGTSSVAR